MIGHLGGREIKMGAFENIGRRKNDLPLHVRIEKAVAKLKTKGVENDNCPRCTVFDWNVDILEIPANSLLASSPILGLISPKGAYFSQSPSHLATGVLSVLSLVCKNCGYSIFHNMSMLDD
jgi:hypothetical protein